MESRLRGATAVLRQTCEELLLGMGISDDMLRDLLETQKGWDSDSLQANLISQMGTADHNDFEAIANNLRKRMDELGAKLGLDSQWKVSGYARSVNSKPDLRLTGNLSPHSW
jgi:hypothetical protein